MLDIETLALFVVGLVAVTSIPLFSVFKEIDAQSLPQPLDNSTTQLPGRNGSNVSVISNLDIDEARGTFGSLQTDNNNVTWVTTGRWDMISDPVQTNKDSSQMSFNTTINMATTNNSDRHEHKIDSFQLTDGSLESSGEGSTLVLNGTVSIETDESRYTDVPISIKIMDESPIIVSINSQSNIMPKWQPGGGLISLWVDPNAIEDHFGDTPVYGGIRKAR
jgi:hypothetical protein